MIFQIPHFSQVYGRLLNDILQFDMTLDEYNYLFTLMSESEPTHNYNNLLDVIVYSTDGSLLNFALRHFNDRLYFWYRTGLTRNNFNNYRYEMKRTPKKIKLATLVLDELRQWKVENGIS